MNTPDVSVVMSVYNAAGVVRETVESILDQQDVDLEFIIVNDGSTDGTGQILAQYESIDKRIKVITQQNTGLTKALIRGCAEARGVYIARQDAGDVSHPERLKLQLAAFQANKDLTLVSCWTEYCAPQWEPLYTIKGSGIASNPIRILNNADANPIEGPYHHGSVVFMRSVYLAVGGYRKEFYYAQDWDLWYRLSERGTFQVIQRPLYRARIFTSSISMQNKQRQEDFAALALSALKKRGNGFGDQEILHEAIKLTDSALNTLASSREQSQGFYFIAECLRQNHDHRCLEYYKNAVRRYPSGKYLIRILQVGLNLVLGA